MKGKTKMKTKNVLLKFALCAVVALSSCVALAAKDEDRGSSFVKILCYAIAGGLASALARRRAARKKEGQKGSAGTSKTAVLIVLAGVLFCVFAYSIHALAERFRIDFFWDETPRCCLAALVMTMAVMTPIIFSVLRRGRAASSDSSVGNDCAPNDV